MIQETVEVFVNIFKLIDKRKNNVYIKEMIKAQLEKYKLQACDKWNYRGIERKHGYIS